jgi:hypothetical protein
MGGITKEERIQGRTLSDAFKKLQDEDREELGDDYYCGGWHNSQGVKEVSERDFDFDYITKHEPARALCVRKPVLNSNKVKTTVTNYPVKGARKWVTRYVVRNGRGPLSDLYASDNQKDAIDKARKYSEKRPDNSYEVHIVKELVGQPTRVAEINYKKSSKECDGVWDVMAILPY